MWFLGVFLFVVLAAIGAFIVLDLIGAAVQQRNGVSKGQILTRAVVLGLDVALCLAIGAGLDWWNLA